jgi:hypothetical protein
MNKTNNIKQNLFILSSTKKEINIKSNTNNKNNKNNSN